MSNLVSSPFSYTRLRYGMILWRSDSSGRLKRPSMSGPVSFQRAPVFRQVEEEEEDEEFFYRNDTQCRISLPLSSPPPPPSHSNLA